MTIFRKRQGDAKPSQDEITEVAGERGLPSVNKATSLSGQIGRYTALGFLALILVVGLIKYYRGITERRTEQQIAATHDLKRTADKTLAPFALPPPDVPPPETENSLLHRNPDINAAHALSVGGSAQQRPLGPDGQPVKTPEEELLERKLKSPVLMRTEAIATPAVSGFQPNPAYDDKQTSRGLGEDLKGTFTSGTQATLLPNRDFLLTKGTYFDCTLETEIDSSLSGMVSCILSRDIYSDNGRVVLLEAATKLTGEYRGDMKPGQARLFLLWTRAKTPKGVVVDLASPGTDPVGRAGVEGYVDNHFWDRFGAAILFSAVTDAGAAIANRNINGNNNVVTAQPSAVQASQNLVGEILKPNINLPATLQKHRGDHVGIHVARDLDFRSVYDLKLEEFR